MTSYSSTKQAKAYHSLTFVGKGPYASPVYIYRMLNGQGENVKDIPNFPDVVVPSNVGLITYDGINKVWQMYSTQGILEKTTDRFSSVVPSSVINIIREEAEPTEKIYWNTWDTWHLIPSSRPEVAETNPVYKYIDIPGMDGQLDLSDYLIGRPTRSNRQGSWEFIVVNGWRENRMDLRKELANIFDGRKMKIRLDDDLSYYYTGRFAFKGMKPGPQYSSVTIEYQLEPYRYNRATDKEDGL